MKKYLVLWVLSLILAIVWGGRVFGQNPEVAAKPSFITLAPGQYVNGWPAFTVSYPKEWVEQPRNPGEVFKVGVPRPSLPPSPVLSIAVFVNPLPLDNSAKMLITLLGRLGKDFNVLYDRPYQLKDGTPAQEAEFEWVITNGPKLNTFLLATKKDVTSIWIAFYDDKGKTGEDLKNIAYSLTFLQGREEPVKVPPDVQEFLDKWCSDILSGDVERIMTNYSDQFSHSNMNKAVMEQWLRNDPFSPIKAGLASMEATVTVFEPQGDKACVDGFFLSKGKNAPNAMKAPMASTQIIKENGQWKFYGNHK